jgi:hypothetical protein
MTVACSRVSSMSVRAVITSYALVVHQGSDPKLGVGRSREMFTGTGKNTPGGAGTLTGHKDTRITPVPVPFCSKTPGHAGGAGTHTVPTLFIPRSAERDTPITRVRARLGRVCADGACGRGCAVDSTGHALYWLVWAGNRTERLKEKQRLTSCDGAQELHVIIWLLAMYRGRLRGEARER